MDKKGLNTIYRQGDVLVMAIDKYPEGVDASKVKQHKRGDELILAYGEVTGHHHTVVGNSLVAEALAEEHGNDIFFELLEPSALTHDEHETVKLPAGKYRKIQQQEYSPEAYRDVHD